MAQSYTYNGTQINDWDGTKGVIVSTFQHDSSPEVSIIQEAVARANGTALRDARARAKTISVSGSIVGSSQADFEQRVDSLKALFATPQGTLTLSGGYGTVDYRIAVFEEGESWTRSYINDASVADSALWDFTHYKIGRRGLMLEAATGTPKDAIWNSLTLDLSAFASTDTLKLWAYIPDTTKLTSIRLQLATDGSNLYSTTWNSGFSNGWNELTVLRSALTTTGSPSWASIGFIKLTVTGSNASPATVTFDDLRISSTTESRSWQATVSGPIEVRREPFHVNWCPFTLAFTCSDGSATSSLAASVKVTTTTKPQRFLTRYLSGSGPQHLALTSIVGSSIPSEIQVTDHFADEFAVYEDTGASSEHGYWMPVSTFETTETWSAGSADATNKRVGAQGRKLSPTASTTVTANRTITAANYSSLPNTEKAKLWVYVDNGTNFASVDVEYHTTAGVDYYTKNVTGLVTGWNLLSIAKKDFSVTGSPNWNSIVQLTVKATANGSGTCNVTFDDWRWEDALNCTGGNYTTADAANTTWEIGPFGAYRSALAYFSDSVTPAAAMLTNKPVQDGELIALVRVPSTGAVGIIARSSSATPLSGAQTYVLGRLSPSSATESSVYLADTSNLNVQTAQGNHAIPSQDWVWIRLVCRGSLAQLWTRDVGRDAWVKAAEVPVSVIGSGLWGIYGLTGAQIAHVELIDYATPQVNTLRLLGGPFSTASGEGMLLVDTKTLTAREGPWRPGNVAGSFPALRSGFNEGAVLHPAGIIGTPRFRYVAEDMYGWHILGAGGDKFAIKVSSGSQTYVRRRGSFLYLAERVGTPPAYPLTVRIETDTAGNPSGTLVDANATLTIPPGAIAAQYANTTDPWNASLVPVELIWPADIPIGASTDYWVVLVPHASEVDGSSWATPYLTTGGLPLHVYSPSAWVDPSLGGYVILATNYPNATVSTPWYDAQAYTPTYR